MSYKSLIINPGSTFTKIGVFEDENLLFEETLRHPHGRNLQICFHHRSEGLP